MERKTEKQNALRKKKNQQKKSYCMFSFSSFSQKFFGVQKKVCFVWKSSLGRTNSPKRKNKSIYFSFFGIFFIFFLFLFSDYFCNKRIPSFCYFFFSLFSLFFAMRTNPRNIFRFEPKFKGNWKRFFLVRNKQFLCFGKTIVVFPGKKN